MRFLATFRWINDLRQIMLKALLLGIAFCFLPLCALLAQTDGEIDDLKRRLAALEKMVRDQAVSYQEVDAQITLDNQNLERELSKIIGQIEELYFNLATLDDHVKRLVKDIESRLVSFGRRV